MVYRRCQECQAYVVQLQKVEQALIIVLVWPYRTYGSRYKQYFQSLHEK